jgi:hypothetical protein
VNGCDGNERLRATRPGRVAGISTVLASVAMAGCVAPAWVQDTPSPYAYGPGYGSYEVSPPAYPAYYYAPGHSSYYGYPHFPSRVVCLDHDHRGGRDADRDGDHRPRDGQGPSAPVPSERRGVRGVRVENRGQDQAVSPRAAQPAVPASPRGARAPKSAEELRHSGVARRELD